MTDTSLRRATIGATPCERNYWPGLYTRTVSDPSRVLWLDDHEMRAWRALVTSTSRLTATLDGELLAAHRLSLADYEVFVCLSEAPERRLRMTELATLLHLSPSGLTRRLDRLARTGLVAREQCPSDRRGTFAVLTDDGFERLHEAAPTHVRGVREHFVDRLTRQQLDAVADAMEAVLPCSPLAGIAACKATGAAAPGVAVAVDACDATS